MVGLVAQLVDGGLGMGYGVTSSTLLVLAGLTPLAASASVHFSELATNLASGVAHSRLQNVDWPVVGQNRRPRCRRCVPRRDGSVRLGHRWAKPIMAIVLAVLGIYIIVRFVVGIRPQLKKQLTVKFLGAARTVRRLRRCHRWRWLGARSPRRRCSVAGGWSRARLSAQSIRPSSRSAPQPAWAF